eukprot:848496_1
MEELLKNLRSDEKYEKYVIPEDWRYEKARDLFKNPNVTDKGDLPIFKWGNPKEKELTDFLVETMNFNLDRVKRGIERLKKCKGKSGQKRLDSFFSLAPSTKTVNISNFTPIDHSFVYNCCGKYPNIC